MGRTKPISKAEALGVTQAPAPPVNPFGTIYLENGNPEALSEGTARTIDRALINDQIAKVHSGLKDEQRKAVMEEFEPYLAKHHKVIIETREARATLNTSESVRIKDEAALRQALGVRFRDLVDTKTSFAPTEKLIEMATNPKEPRREEIAAW